MSGSAQARPSAAIRIVAPSGATPTPSSPTPSNTAREQGSRHQTPKKTPKCRNILIHGFCKNEGKGCIYDHSDGSSVPTHTSMALTSPAQSTSNSTSPSVNVNAPVFVPKASIPPVASPDPFKPAYLRDPSELIEAPQPASNPSNPYGEVPSDYDLANRLAQTDLDGPNAYNGMEMMQPGFDPGSHFVDPQLYYSHVPTFAHQPLNYHLYTQLPYLPSNATSSRSGPHRFFMSDTLREDLQRRSEVLYSSVPPAGTMQARALPEEVHVYHSLVPLESTEKERRKWFVGFSSLAYKATHREDGTVVVLRRIEGFRLTQESAFAAVETWNKIKHPHIAALREAFTTRAFGDYSLVFVYDYYPTAQTLFQLHVAPPDPHPAMSMPTHAPRSRYSRHHHKSGRGGSGSGMGSGAGDANGLLEERVLWSYVVQIANAMKEVHDRGLAFRTLDVSKVLVTGRNRIRVNCCGIVDVLTHDPRLVNIEALQQEDLLAFGRLVIALCTKNAPTTNNLAKVIESVSRNYTPDVKNVVLFLISKPAPNKIIDQLLEMFGTRLLTEINAIQGYVDQLEGELMSELENGRLVRLMSKLGFINERPDFSHELRWSETGDRYIISLFRDYVFHQVDEGGSPVVNLTHVITCLNKLDAGTDERIMLVSRDEQTCFVVSYKEIKACIESAFGELTRRR